MEDNNLLEQMSVKGFDKEKVVAQVLADTKLIEVLFEGIATKRATVKYGSEKVLRAISEVKPEILYPYFDKFVEMMSSGNSVLKWGAIMIIANLTVVDYESKFDDIFDKYYQPVKGPILITASNIISSSPIIALEKPYLAEKITKEILVVEKAKYKTPECKNIAIGHAIDAFAQFIEIVQDKKIIVNFVKRHVNNNRESVKKSATKFLRKYSRFTK